MKKMKLKVFAALIVFGAALFAMNGCSKETITEEIPMDEPSAKLGPDCSWSTVNYTACATINPAFYGSWNVGQLDKHAFAPCGAVPSCNSVEHTEVQLFIGGHFFDWSAGYPNVTPTEQQAIIAYAFTMASASPPLCPVTGDPKDIIDMDFARDAFLTNHWIVNVKYGCCSDELPD